MVRGKNSLRVLALAAALLAGAASGVARAGTVLDDWQPVDEAVLARATGGSGGLSLSFALDVVGAVDGVPVAGKSLSVGSFHAGAGSPQSAQAAYAQASALLLQNSANQQLLQVRTVLNVSLTELAVVHALQSQWLVSSWQSSALRP
jgi:hypothetical protein